MMTIFIRSRIPLSRQRNTNPGVMLLGASFSPVASILNDFIRKETRISYFSKEIKKVSRGASFSESAHTSLFITVPSGCDCRYTTRSLKWSAVWSSEWSKHSLLSEAFVPKMNAHRAIYCCMKVGKFYNRKWKKGNFAKQCNIVLWMKYANTCCAKVDVRGCNWIKRRMTKNRRIETSRDD